jgi:hypothetical protein
VTRKCGNRRFSHFPHKKRQTILFCDARHQFSEPLTHMHTHSLTHTPHHHHPKHPNHPKLHPKNPKHPTQSKNPGIQGTRTGGTHTHTHWRIRTHTRRCGALDRDAFQRQAHALPLSSLFKINALARVPGLATLLGRYQEAVLWWVHVWCMCAVWETACALVYYGAPATSQVGEPMCARSPLSACTPVLLKSVTR